MQRARIGPSGLSRGAPASQPFEAAVHPLGRQLFLDAVLAEPVAQDREIHLIQGLVLVEAGEHHCLLAGRRIVAQHAAVGTALDHFERIGRRLVTGGAVAEVDFSIGLDIEVVNPRVDPTFSFHDRRP